MALTKLWMIASICLIRYNTSQKIQAGRHQIMIRGLNHLTLAVRDLERASQFYQQALGCRLLARWPQGVYLLAGNLWLALIAEPECRQEPLPEYTHFALDVAPEDFAAASQRLLDYGAEIWKDNSSEGDSLYFLDPDGHKLELHASRLYDRLLSAQAAPWDGLEILVSAQELS